MPTETRTIVFDNADIKDALTDRYHSANQEAGEESVGRLSISNEEGITIQLLSANDERAIFSFREDEVISALITHCRSYNIPVPQKAVKSVVIYAGSIGLRLDIS